MTTNSGYNLEQIYYTDDFVYISDKGNGHSYIEHYSKLFDSIKDTAQCIVELGVCRGGSIKLWREYFSKAKIIAFDIYPECIKFNNIYSNIHIHIMDCTKPEILPLVPDNSDIIIDDASHVLEQTLKSFTLLWPKVKPGGFYIIEDVPDIDTWSTEFNKFNIEYQIIDDRLKRKSKDNVLFIFKK